MSIARSAVSLARGGAFACLHYVLVGLDIDGHVMGGWHSTGCLVQRYGVDSSSDPFPWCTCGWRNRGM